MSCRASSDNDVVFVLHVVASVLERHGVSTADNVDLGDIAAAIIFGRSPSQSPRQRLEHDLRVREQSKRKAEMLEELLALYRAEQPGTTVMTSTESRIAVADGRTVEEAISTFSLAIEHLDVLRRAERAIADREIPEPPRNRPTSSKNAAAETIFRRLRDHGVGTWEACSIIADLFSEAEVEDRPRDKIRRSMYDKLSRL